MKVVGGSNPTSYLPDAVTRSRSQASLQLLYHAVRAIDKSD